MTARTLYASLIVLTMVAPVAAQQPSPGGAPPSSTRQPAVQVDSSAIVGSTVRSAEGKDIGKVDRLMVDPRDGRIATVVVSMGGTLGMGGRKVAVPWNAVKVAQDDGKVVLTVNQQILDQAPAASPSTGSDKSDDKSTDKK